MRFFWVVMASLALAWATGCSRVPERQRIEETVVRAKSMADRGDVDGAITVLEKAMAKKAYRQFQPFFLQEIVLTLVVTGRIDQAEARIYRAAQEDPDVAVAALRGASGYFIQEGKFDVLRRWCERVAELKLPERALAEVADIHLSALRLMQKRAELLDLLPKYVLKLSPAIGQQLTDRVGRSLLQEGHFEDAQVVLAFIDRRTKEDAGWRPLGISLRMDLMLAQGQWDPAEAYLKQMAAEVSDGQLTDLLNKFLGATLGAQQTELAERTCLFVIREGKEKRGARETAARNWVTIPQREGQVAVVLDRLAQLRGLGLDASAVTHLTENAYGLVMEKGVDADVKAYVEVCESLLSAGVPDTEKNSLKGMMLDSDFRIEDYGQALRLLEGGIAGQNAQWHEVMINKVKAHQALKEGRKQEAVERFRKFMGYIAGQATEQIDPVTGLRYSREMILGLNWKRIGDILASTGDKDSARDAYQRAEASYRDALKKAGDGSDEAKQIREDLKKIPGAKQP